MSAWDTGILYPLLNVIGASNSAANLPTSCTSSTYCRITSGVPSETNPFSNPLIKDSKSLIVWS